MSDLTLNKYAAAILASALGFMGLKEISHYAMHSTKLEKPVYMVGSVEPTGAEGTAEPLPFPQQSWIDAMDAERGAKVFKKCKSCHNAEEGGANGTGPNLYDIVGHAAGRSAGFNYTGALTSAGVVWNYEALDAFLTKPGKYISGTAMNFVGLKKESDRAAVIAYLRDHAPTQFPMPTPAAAAAAEDGAVEVIEENIPTDIPVETPTEVEGGGH